MKIKLAMLLFIILMIIAVQFGQSSMKQNNIYNINGDVLHKKRFT